MTITEKARLPLSRDRVVDAALRVMDAEGLEAVSMRRVARELGVEAMSLYHHIEDKDDLLDGLCSVVMREFRYPEDRSDWMATARFAANEWRRVLKAHPNVISVFAGRRKPMTDVDALGPMEFALETIGRAGIEGRDAVYAFNVMGGYIMGFVMMEVGQMFGAGTLDTASPDPAAIAQALPADRVPSIIAALPHMAECDPDAQFDFGLELLLAGLVTRFGSDQA